MGYLPFTGVRDCHQQYNLGFNQIPLEESLFPKDFCQRSKSFKDPASFRDRKVIPEDFVSFSFPPFFLFPPPI